MPGEAPRDGSPDPVGLEPDVYEIDEEQFDEENIARVTAEADLPLPGHRFDPAADAFDADRQDSYEDWISADKAGKRRQYR